MRFLEQIRLNNLKKKSFLNLMIFEKKKIFIFIFMSNHNRNIIFCVCLI